jgi:hypothetical protein
MACSGGVKRTTTEVLSNVVRSKTKGPFTSTDGKYRKFTDDAEVDLQFLVKKHKEGIANGETFVDRKGDAVLGCVFYSLPTKLLAGGFAEGRMYERALILWVREQSECCQNLNYSSGQWGWWGHAQGRGDVRGVGVVHRRPDGSGCQGGVGASRGAKQAGAGPGPRAQCSTRCCTGAGGLRKAP